MAESKEAASKARDEHRALASQLDYYKKENAAMEDEYISETRTARKHKDRKEGYRAEFDQAQERLEETEVGISSCSGQIFGQEGAGSFSTSGIRTNLSTQVHFTGPALPYASVPAPGGSSPRSTVSRSLEEKISRKESESVTIPPWPKIDQLDICFFSRLTSNVLAACGVQMHGQLGWQDHLTRACPSKSLETENPRDFRGIDHKLVTGLDKFQECGRCRQGGVDGGSVSDVSQHQDREVYQRKTDHCNHA